MKKILGIFLIAGSLVACNNEADTTPTEDTISQDSINMMTPPPVVNDSLNMNTGDSLNTIPDSANRQ